MECATGSKIAHATLDKETGKTLRARSMEMGFTEDLWVSVGILGSAVGPRLARAQASWLKSQGEGGLRKRSKERSCSCWKGAEAVEANLSPYPPSGPEAPAKLFQPQAAMEISTSSPANNYPILLHSTEFSLTISHPAACTYSQACPQGAGPKSEGQSHALLGSS